MMAGILTEIERLHKEKGQISVSLVGAGGKTSLMRCLAYYLPGPVICTTSTKLSSDEAAFFEEHVVWQKYSSSLPILDGVENNLLLTGGPLEVNGIQKLSGLTEEQLNILNHYCTEKQIPLIIEADGSKRRPLKAPADWEPVIPAFTNLVIVVIGVAGLMKPLNEEYVFRSQIFSQLTDLEMGQPIGLSAIVRYLKHPLGGLKRIPDQAKRSVLFNLAGCDAMELVDKILIEEQLSGVFDGVFFGNVDLLP